MDVFADRRTAEKYLLRHDGYLQELLNFAACHENLSHFFALQSQ